MRAGAGTIVLPRSSNRYQPLAFGIDLCPFENLYGLAEAGRPEGIVSHQPVHLGLVLCFYEPKTAFGLATDSL